VVGLFHQTTLGLRSMLNPLLFRETKPGTAFDLAGVGIIEGPGWFSWNAGLSKRFALTEHAGLKLEGTFTNVTNRVNLGDPQLNITNNSFGRITNARGGEFGGGRTGQVFSANRFLIAGAFCCKRGLRGSGRVYRDPKTAGNVPRLVFRRVVLLSFGGTCDTLTSPPA